MRHPVPNSRCPHCGARIETSSWEDGGRMPEPGDLTICAYCARLLRFDRRLVLAALTDHDERQVLFLDRDVRAAVAKVRRQGYPITEHQP